ncbi:aldehyde dehydrogenase family protein [Aquimarina hainanensis]|uniref:Aldehyde dehydrogenase family protein n=1 Tax=Aquimarina hainanensis TaxID=1578017 RepID=A0ABW5N951_9FLAO|nr:aldehyde dehydrogenase family protein [Aquimarina sp. TRL1]QKX05453.1 aldehyde dehydrogenase [Aquimarina sp. TRL1]
MKSNFINGKWIDGSSDVTFSIHNPATEEEIQTISEAGNIDIDTAINAAHYQIYQGDWYKMLPNKKEAVLLKYADIIEQHTTELSELLVAEHGKLLADAQKEVGATVNCFRYYAGWATKIEGSTLGVSLSGGNHFAYTQKEPIGVVAAIAPWNVPMMMYAWKIAPALACGCAVVFKPSEETPLTALRLAELSQEAGIPDGVINVVNGRGATVGNYLINHPKVHKITFTGSSQVGKNIGKQAGQNLKEFTLELGGKNPVLVLDDADLNSLPKGTTKGIFYNQGQVCVSGSRIYLPKQKYDTILSDIGDIAKTMKVGHGMDQTSQMGPLVSKSHMEHVIKYIDSGIAAGAEVIAGGNKLYNKGYYVAPTVFSNPDNHKIDILKQEIFGPVLVAVSYDGLDDLIQKANDTPYGLAASIWTKNVSNMHYLLSKLHAGMIYVNSPVRSDPNLPLGGFKQSGIGNELGKASIAAFTRSKSVVISY